MKLFRLTMIVGFSLCAVAAAAQNHAIGFVAAYSKAMAPGARKLAEERQDRRINEADIHPSTSKLQTTCVRSGDL